MMEGDAETDSSTRGVETHDTLPNRSASLASKDSVAARTSSGELGDAVEKWAEKLKCRQRISKKIRGVRDNAITLMGPQANKALEQLLREDLSLIHELHDPDPQALGKSCKLGVGLASIVREKVRNLNALQQSLALNRLLTHFRKLGKTNESRDIERGLFFVRLSKLLGSRVSRTCSLGHNWLKLGGFADLKRRASPQLPRSRRGDAAPPKTLLPQTGKEENGEGAIVHQKMESMHKALCELSAREPVNYWRFVIDPRGTKGFNNTCLHHFVVTLLAKRGLVEFGSDSNGVLTIRAAQRALSEDCEAATQRTTDENSQAILTQWDYSSWRNLCSALALNDNSNPLFALPNDE